MIGAYGAGARAPAAFGLVMMLAACTPGHDDATALLQQALASAQASRALAGAAGPAAPPQPQPAAGTQPARPATARARGSAPPATADALMGVTADQLRRMLGEPSIRRPEGPAEVWLYEAPACRLDVILFAEGAALVVGHAAARALGGADGVTESACLSAIAGAPAPTPWASQGPRA
jgi:hypothetical protein